MIETGIATAGIRARQGAPHGLRRAQTHEAALEGREASNTHQRAAADPGNSRATVSRMNAAMIGSMDNARLLSATRELARRSCSVEADLLVHLGEIDERRLYLDLAFSSMFAFCTGELGFAEGAAYNRIVVARAARKLPALIEAVRSGRVHLAGLRLLVPHLTEANHADLLQQAAGRSKEQIAELVARLAPRPAPVEQLRKLPSRNTADRRSGGAELFETGAPAPAGIAPGTAPLAPAPRRPLMLVAEDVYRLQLAINREFREEIREAQALLRHRFPEGDLATLFRAALGVLVADVKKKRFAVGRKPRSDCVAPVETNSRHVPDAMKRGVYERDGGRCTFTDSEGRRCDATGALELDHLEGFARTHRHELKALRLLCHAHNQHAADQLYGRAFMEAARSPACPGTSRDGGEDAGEGHSQRLAPRR